MATDRPVHCIRRCNSHRHFSIAVFQEDILKGRSLQQLEHMGCRFGSDGLHQTQADILQQYTLVEKAEELGYEQLFCIYSKPDLSSARTTVEAETGRCFHRRGAWKPKALPLHIYGSSHVGISRRKCLNQDSIAKFDKSRVAL